MQTATATGGTQFRPAQFQSSVPPDKLLNSATAGLLVHRVGQLQYHFRNEGLAFSADLVELINSSQLGTMSISLYEEILGTQNRFHWLLHLKQPNDYRILLDMVDHDQEMAEVSLADRMPEKGGGNWERMFVEASMREAVLVPQHGLDHGDDDHDEQDETFQPPAVHQTGQPPDLLLHSMNAPLIVHRSAQVKYEFRKEARYFAFDWARYVNETQAGDATVFLYEETWGQQDRIHWLIHLSALDQYPRTRITADGDPGLRDLLGKQRVPAWKGGGTWEKTFLEGSIKDILWAPRPLR